MSIIDYGKARRENRARRNRASQTRIKLSGYLLIIQKDQRTGWEPHYQFSVCAIREYNLYGPGVICMPTQLSFGKKSDAIRYAQKFIDEKISENVYSWRLVGSEVAVA